MPEIRGRIYRIQVHDLVFDSTAQPQDRRALSIDFDTERDLKPSPNDSIVTLWNLAEDTRKRLHAIGNDKDGVYCSIEAGYESTGMSLIFRGDLREVRSYRDEEDWITEVSSGDGEKRLRAARTARTYPRGTTLEDLARKLIKDLGVGEGNAIKVLRGLRLSGSGSIGLELGGVTAGKAAREIDRVLGAAGLDWSVQSDQVQITKGGEPVAGAPSVLLRHDTGLVGSPEMSGDIVTVTAKLIPGLEPGYPVELDARHVQGVFRIERARYTGTWFSDAWHVRMECKEVK